MEGGCSVTQKYKGVIVYHNPPPAIWLCNEWPDFKEHEQYWELNSLKVELEEPLFNQ